MNRALELHTMDVCMTALKMGHMKGIAGRCAISAPNYFAGMSAPTFSRLRRKFDLDGLLPDDLKAEIRRLL
jgi:hypothetical protein